jgi:RNA polymerase sigma-70 factor (ECF subfamily)
MPSDQDQEWLQDAMQRYAGILVRYVTGILNDPERARDVVQDAFIRLCRERRAAVEERLPEWLHTVCRNRALDILRKEKRMRPLEESSLQAEPCASPSPAVQTENRDLHDKVLSLLSALPRNQQEVVRLKFQSGLSYAEISRVTSLTVTNVGFLIHTALKTLRKQLHAENTFKA